MEISRKISNLKKLSKTVSRICEVCKMEYTVTGIPLLVDRKIREFERQHGELGHSKKGGNMNKLKSLWNFFDGKKTVIGAIICFAVYVVKGVSLFFGLDIVDNGLLTQINEAGMTLLGVGLVHKAVKQM